MEREKDIFDLLRDWVKSEWPILALIGTAGFVTLIVLPHFLIKDNGGWNELIAVSTLVYMLITLCTFSVVLRAAIVTSHQLSEISKGRQLQIIIEFSKMSDTREMYDAMNTVFNYTTPEEVVSDPNKDFHRRLVATHWNTIAWTALEKLDGKMIRSRFEQAMFEVWIKLRPLEIAKRCQIEKVEHPDLSPRASKNAIFGLNSLPDFWTETYHS
jgi:hypothetical protein